MTDDPSTKRWNIATAIALAVAIVAGIAVSYYIDLMMGIFTILIISGAYLALSFFIKDRNDRSGGPSEYGAAVMGGVLLAGIGACGFVYRFTDNVMITVACVLGVVMLASIVMIFFYKAYL